MKIRKIDQKWVILGVGFFTLLMASAVRSSFGAFFTPLQEEFGTGRAPLALTVSISMLVGALCQPFVGKLADVLGSKVVLVVGAIVTGLGLLGLSFAQNLVTVYVLFGLMLGVGLSAAGLIPNTALVTRWFAESRAMALSITTSGFSAGRIIMVPLITKLLLMVGWRTTYVIMGLSFLLIVVPVVLWLAKSSPTRHARPPGSGELGARPQIEEAISLRRAVRIPAFWKLLTSFTVCGFTIGLIFTHMIPLAQDRGLSAVAAANFFALTGVTAILGSVAMSSLSDRIGRKNPLSVAYLMRALTLVLLGIPWGTGIFIVAGVIVGLSSGTAPLTSAMTGDLFGRRSVGTLFGLMFLSHEVASAVGSYLGGLTFDIFGSYQLILLAAAIAGVFGSLTAFSILEKRPQPTEAMATGV